MQHTTTDHYSQCSKEWKDVLHFLGLMCSWASPSPAASRSCRSERVFWGKAKPTKSTKQWQDKKRNKESEESPSVDIYIVSGYTVAWWHKTQSNGWRLWVQSGRTTYCTCCICVGYKISHRVNITLLGNKSSYRNIVTLHNGYEYTHCGTILGLWSRAEPLAIAADPFHKHSHKHILAYTDMYTGDSG